MKRRAFIKSMIFHSGMLAFGSYKLSAAPQNAIKIFMVYNNAGSNGDYTKRWGLSIWIEQNNDAVLFDTGKTPKILWRNILKSGIDIQKLSKIVISHNHKDHINGLPILLKELKSSPKVLVPHSDLKNIRSKFSKADISGIKGPAQINDYLWSTGEMFSSTIWESISEQSVVISQNDSMILLTGCAHPGIVKITEKAIDQHGKKIKLVGGGFHLMEHKEQQILEISSDLKKLNVLNIAPSHCTGKLATNVFKDEWKDRYIDFSIGKSLNI